MSEVEAHSQQLHAKNMVVCISGMFLFLKPTFCLANSEILCAAYWKSTPMPVAKCKGKGKE